LRQFFTYGQGGAQFHALGDKSSFSESITFHLRLPRLVGSELVCHGLKRRAGLLGLLVLWEVANLVGFLTALPRRPTPRLIPIKTDQRRNSL
jgi:hypothetical protein